ncbi:MAG: heavy metal-binding domain-containing protein [Pirellulaceae bacterium]
MWDLIVLGIPLVVLLVGLMAGRITETAHFAALERREEESRGLILSNVRRYATSPNVVDGQFVTGHVVISTDYFKSVCAALRRLVGGRVISFEKLVERGRREALLRLKTEAAAGGADLVLNVRYETMTIARSRQGSGVMGIEVLAYGTAVKTARS